ncbi:MAG: hypothetical protein HY363_04440 [Candidatus Aenigmarchaeota archaeon]|nr:hypothetical protein [Candidatus Aenigmarchaeota archaeon]
MYDLTTLLKVNGVRTVLDDLATEGARDYANQAKMQGVHAPMWEDNFAEEKKRLYNAYLRQLGARSTKNNGGSI